MINFRGFNYSDKTRLLVGESDDYLKNPIRQKTKSWMRLARVFLGAKGLKNKWKTLMFLPFTKTQTNLFFSISKHFKETFFFIFDNLVLEITKNLKQLGVQAHPYFHFVRKKDVLSVFNEWMRSEKGKNKEGLLYFRIRKRIIFLELFRLALLNYLKASKTKVMVLPEDRSDLALVAIAVAKKLKIKSINFQHEFYSDKKIKWMYKNHKDAADLHLVYGNHFKKEYEKNGLPLWKNLLERYSIILLIELNPKTRKLVKRGISKNQDQLKNIHFIVSNRAIYDKKTELNLTNDYGSSTLSDKGEFVVKTSTFGEFLKLFTKDIDLLKLDIEGAEKELFTSSKKRLVKIPTLIGELHGENNRKLVESTLKKTHEVLVSDLYPKSKTYMFFARKLEGI